ncbi:ABC transporter ATP-binding protein [Curvivirga aplysinae]|uniref:ABC transporter ATP-binding protein n=1 Tax=Curvivirga aplysinae TaxID=2529852 RepID=UPI0012BBF277|nr:ABC transporter ATP-binding protein [Curvivirga aplysinae]MTI08766.1 ABC transporter ATP-binding protein [Curvivirga aplysinae]
MSEKNVLELQQVVRHYNTGDGDKLEVLKDINLTVGRGELVALVAPSGTGKSTLLHVAGLLERPDGGNVLLNGINCNNLNDRKRTLLRRSDVGFVYQFHHLLPEFTAMENVVMPQLIAGISKSEAKRKASELLDKVGLSSRVDHRPAKLSGGEQQRVAIARAIANSPSLLLADEPTGNLDPETADIVFNLFIGLVRDQGLSALIATHNHELAQRMDRMMVLGNGKIN